MHVYLEVSQAVLFFGTACNGQPLLPLTWRQPEVSSLWNEFSHSFFLKALPLCLRLGRAAGECEQPAVERTGRSGKAGVGDLEI